jgi:hypothetical protein
MVLLAVLLMQTDGGQLTAKIGDFGLSAKMYIPAMRAEAARERTVANPCMFSSSCP